MPDYGLKGRKAVVCSSSKGLGFASAQALAAEGVDLVLGARGVKELQQAKHAIEQEYGVAVWAEPVDLLEAMSRQAWLQAIQHHWPEGPDILVHNIGGPSPGSVLETSLTEWQAGFDRLFQVTVELNQRWVPAMRARQWGRILQITSSIIWDPSSELPVSTAIRSATTAYLKLLANDLAPDGVTVNAIAPGLIETERLAHLKQGANSESWEARLQEIPLKRLGTPAEFAAAVAFLASDPARYITGQTLFVDGGAKVSPF
jgi:3-oxoacyl-[acyl-carrier protein] reductase